MLQEMDAYPVLKTLRPLAPLPTEISPGGHLQLPLRCLLCDVYGTLLISASGDIGMANKNRQVTETLGALLSKYGQRIHPEALLDRFHSAIVNEHTRKKAQGVDYPEVKVERIWEEILFAGDSVQARSFSMEFEILMNPVWPMPGLSELLQAGRRSSILIGIVSNAQFYTSIILEWLIGKDLQSAGFDSSLMFLSYKHGTAKPSGYLFQLAAKRLHALGINPCQTAYMGNDMRNDIAPAHAAGFQTILFAGDKRSLRMRKRTPQCADINPNLVITHLNQLTRCLGRHSDR